jgi:hypothetical protein
MSQFLSAQQEKRVLLYNIGFGGVTSGIGAVINKQKNSNWKEAFVKGFWQGAVGGTLNYSGKKMLYLISKHHETAYALPANILHFAGTSIMENAALGEPFLQNWNFDYGPVRVDFSVNGKKPAKVRFLPMTIFAVIEGSKSNRLDLKTTLLTGNIAFANRKGYYFTNNGQFNLGLSYGRSFAYMAQHPDTVVYPLIAHELVHQFQFKDYQIFNSWLKPFEKEVNGKLIQKVFSKYIYFDVPYFFAAYTIEGSSSYYYKNFFEFEAERFATNRFVK